jgi:hypothetical protein
VRDRTSTLQRGERTDTAPVRAPQGGAGVPQANWWQRWRRSIGIAVAVLLLFKGATELVAVLSASPGHAGSALLSPWNVWDTGWWTNIADHGYVGAMQPDADSTAFAPAFALAISAVDHVLPIDSLGAAMLVSTLSLLLAAVVLHRVVDNAYGPRAATATLIVLLTFPAGFFLAAPYSEALSLAAVALVIYGMQQQRWWLAGTAAAIAMLSKYVLVVVPVALIVEYGVRRWQRLERPRVRDVIAIAAPSAVAGVAWLAYMQATFHSALHFLGAEKTAWLHAFSSPANVVHRMIDSVFKADPRPAWTLTNVVDDVAVIATLALGVWMLAGRYRREQPGWTAMVVLTAAVFLCMTVPDSATRYLLPIAPVFAVLGIAAARRPRIAAAAILCSAGLMFLQLTHFTQRLWTG